MLEMKCQTALPRLVEQSFLGHLCLKHTDVSALNVSHILAQRGNFSRLSKALLHWDIVCRHLFPTENTFPTDKFLNQFLTPYIEKHLCSTKILGTQLFRTTQMCQGSTCHVVAQHGDISKLNKALLLTWEVCANIAIKTSKKISQCHAPKNTRQTKANQQRQHLWHKDSWDTWPPRCAHVRVPRYMSKRTAAREPWLRSRVRVNAPVF